MANVGSLFVVLGLQASDYQNGLRKATKEANTAMNQIKREFAKLDLKQAVIGVTVLTTAFIYAGKKFADTANEADKNKRRFDMVFGGMAAANDAWVDSYSKGVGRNKDDLQGFMATFDMFLKNTGMGEERAAAMSRAMVKLGVDTASFFNITESPVMESYLKSLSGMARGLIQYGIVLKGVTQTDEQGNEILSAKMAKMSNLEKAITMYNALMEQTAKFQGDATRNAGDYGNQLKRLEGNVKTLRIEIGTHLLPVFTGTMQKMNTWLQDSKNVEMMNKWTDAAARLTQKMADYGSWMISHQKAVAGGIEVMFGAYAVNKLVVFGSHIAMIILALERLRVLLPVAAGGVAAAGGAMTLSGGYMMGKQINAGTMTGFGPYGSWMPYGMGAKPNRPSYYDFQSGNLIDKLLPFGKKPQVFDFQAGLNQFVPAPDKVKTALEKIDKAEKESSEYRKMIARGLREYQDMLGIRRMNDAEAHYKDIKQYAEDEYNSLKEYSTKLWDEYDTGIKRQKDAWIDFGNTVANTMMQAMTVSGNAFSNIAKAFEGMLINMAAQYAARAAVFIMLNALSGGSFGGLISIRKFVFGDLFKASGGPVSANRPYIVGERGPEIFIPKTAGNISSSVSTDNSHWELHFHDSKSRQKMIGLPDEQFAEQFKRAVRDGKIEIKKLA